MQRSIDLILSMFGTSDPGDSLHQLVILVGNTDRKPEVHVYALAPTDDVDVRDFVTNTARRIILEMRQKNQVALFAMLVLEINTRIVDPENTEEINRCREMVRNRILDQHPEAREVSLMYAAASDGRRWTGWHELTGPKAGYKDGPTLLEGPLTQNEIMWNGVIVRQIVGIDPNAR